MKRKITSAALILTCLLASGILTGFKSVNAFTQKAGLSQAEQKKQAVTFFAHDPVILEDGTTYTGTISAEGAINAQGENIMYTEVHGMALHCTLIATFPLGTLTIRMNCNMKTFNGRWKILEGTGAYANVKGEGSLIMPNDVDEVLTGYIQR